MSNDKLTVEEVRKQTTIAKESMYDYLVMLMTADKELLLSCGVRDDASMLRSIRASVLSTRRRIEDVIQRWEKENPAPRK